MKNTVESTLILVEVLSHSKVIPNADTNVKQNITPLPTLKRVLVSSEDEKQNRAYEINALNIIATAINAEFAFMSIYKLLS